MQREVSADPLSLSPAEARFDRLVGCLYDCVAEPAGIQTFIERLAEVFRLKAVTLICRHVQTHEVRGLWLHGIEHHWVERYALEFGQDDPLTRHIARSPIAHFYASGLDVPPTSDLSHTRFFREWLAPQDIACAAGATLLQEGPWLTQLIAQRTPVQGAFSREDTALFNRLVPHMQRAFQLRQRMSELELANESLSASLNVLGMAALLLDESGRVIHQNQRARQLLQDSAFLSILDGQLSLADRALGQRLHYAIGLALQASRGHLERFEELIRVPREGRAPLTLMVVPMGSSNAHGTAMLSIFDPARAPELAAGRVRQLFELSEAEAAIAVALCAGQTLEQHAEARCVSLNTVKTQLKSIFLKTGTRRQTELVSLLLTSPAYFMSA